MSQYRRVTEADGCALLQIPGASIAVYMFSSQTSKWYFIHQPRMCRVIPKLLLMNPQKCRSGDDWNPLTFWKTCYSALYTNFTSSTAAKTTSLPNLYKDKHMIAWSARCLSAMTSSHGDRAFAIAVTPDRKQSLTIQLEPKEFRACLCGSKATENFNLIKFSNAPCDITVISVSLSGINWIASSVEP